MLRQTKQKNTAQYVLYTTISGEDPGFQVRGWGRT